MNQFMRIFFEPPEFPPLRLPVPARLIPGIKATIEEIYTKVFFTGVYEGLVLGVILTLMFVPSIKQGMIKGVSDVGKSLS